jgi:uncharacterized protein (TIGR03084 family)
MTVADLIAGLTADLRAEHDALDAVVGGLTAEQWRLPTPSPGWAVADQIAHLTFFDGTAVTAITEPERFASETAELIAGFGEGADMDELTIGPMRTLPPADLLARWRTGREQLLDAAAHLDDGDRVPWYGPSMGARSFLTARLMETWAHGQDVVDAVGAERPPSDRLRHIAQLGVITRRWSYANRGLDVPEGEVRVELSAPSGATWTWNDDGEAGVVRGPAEDFCLVVTQRRHVDDTTLAVEGAAARDWMEHAQAFAGAATEGPRPRS